MTDAATLFDACRSVGEDEAARTALLAALLAYERHPDRRFTTVRDDVTGPIADALHAGCGTLRKSLSNGLVFEFRYTSKIARDFVLSSPAVPDHVWEPQTTRLLLHLAARGGDAIVGGAYFGDQAIPLADALGSRGLCHCFEPDGAQAEMLARNAALNGLDNLRVDRRALWSEAGATLGFLGADAYGRTVPADGGIATTSIDAYVEAEGIARVGLIMLDLEGSEQRVLEGGEGVLRRDGPALVFEIHRAYVDWSEGLEQTGIARFLAGLGYTLFAVRDFQSNYDMAGRPVELVPIATAVTDGPPHGFNILALRELALIEDELFRVTRGVSPKLLLHRHPKLHHPTGGL